MRKRKASLFTMCRRCRGQVLRVEFRIDNSSDRFRSSKTDELVTYHRQGNRSPGTLSDWLQKQGLAEGIRADS